MKKYRVFFNTDSNGKTPGYRETIYARSHQHVRDIVNTDPFYRQFGGIWRINAL